MMSHKFYSRPTLVAMVTKLQTKTVITRLVRQISPISSRLTGVFCVKLSNDVSQILQRPTLVAMANL